MHFRSMYRMVIFFFLKKKIGVPGILYIYFFYKQQMPGPSLRMKKKMREPPPPPGHGLEVIKILLNSSEHGISLAHKTKKLKCKDLSVEMSTK